MKHKQDAETATDRTCFVKRIQELIDAEGGTMYGLGKKVGIPGNTVRRYLTQSEPSRPMLVAIARATGVSVEWLATGEGSKFPGSPVLRNTAGLVNEDQILIRDRFKELNLAGLLIQKETGIEDVRLRAILSGDEDPTAPELVRICRACCISYAWILAGIGLPTFFETDMDGDTVRTALWRQLAFTDLSVLNAELARMLVELRSIKFAVHRVKTDAMAPRINRGDVVIAEKSFEPDEGVSGTYLIQDKGVEEVCYFAKDGGSARFSYENSKIAPKVREWADSGSRFKIIGPVVYKIAMTKF